MRKRTSKSKNIDVRLGHVHRKFGYCSKVRKQSRGGRSRASGYSDCLWFEEHLDSCFINAKVDAKNAVTLYLPAKLNFEADIEETCCNFSVVRRLSRNKSRANSKYKLKTVDFSKVTEVSTSAALVLTAELSKWNDYTNNKLTPLDSVWNQRIFDNFSEMGFFDLFANKPERKISNGGRADKKLIRYIKGQSGDSEATRDLAKELVDLVGKPIDKWTILSSGIGEAILNVLYHAYPGKSNDKPKKYQYWYLTGSYSSKTKRLKISFYDQGIGIPAALPVSKAWERVLSIISLGSENVSSHSALIAGAVEQGRSSSSDSDRGLGFPNMISYLTERKQGSLKIYSKRGSFKLYVQNGLEKITTNNIKHSVDGTLIEWEAVLGQNLEV